MARYHYIARNLQGQEVRASLEASSRLDALEMLRKKGLTAVDLLTAEQQVSTLPVTEQKESARKATSADRPRKGLFAPKVKTTDLAVFCRQLAISVNAGVPLRDAIEDIGGELEQPELQRVSKDMVQQLHDGRSFSQAVASHPQVFNEMFQGLIKVAEESGKLSSTLRQLAEYLEKADRLRRRIKAMAAYPIFIGIFFIIVCMVMTLFILPKFSGIFGEMGANLPGLTRLVFSINTYVVGHSALIFGGTVLLIAGIIIYGRTPAGSFQKDRIKLTMPYAGGCLKKYILARFCRSLAIMVHSGVPIANALGICSESVGNQLLKRDLLGVREMILGGNRIAASLEKSGVFPGLVVRMVAVGEDSGQLPEVLDNVSDLYEDQVEVAVMTSMALFEPLVICVFGAFILVNVLAIYLPVFSVSSGMH